MLRFALPEYRLPKAVLSKEIELIRRLGVKIRVQQKRGDGHFPQRPQRWFRCRVSLHRNLERGLGFTCREPN